MKVHLLHRDRDPDRDRSEPPQAEALVRDLGLETLLDQMAQGDAFLHDVARQTILNPLLDEADLRFRQEVLADCLRRPDRVLSLYRIALSALESTKRVRGWYFNDSPSSILHHSIGLLEALMGDLRELRGLASREATDFSSEGLRTLCTAIERELSDDYFLLLQEHLQRLKFPTGVFLTAKLGHGCKGTNYVLRKPRSIKRGWRDLLRFGAPPSYAIKIAPRDEAGAKALSELKDRGLNLVADALGQSTDHILSFFTSLRWELGFYVGCLNLHEALIARRLRVCMPNPALADRCELTARGLYDVALGLRTTAELVTNDLDGDGKSMVTITGANQGGKSTLLRSIGLAQLMMQSGMFVAASEFRSSVASGLFTHFKREEDAGMESGKLDEELLRMSQIIDVVTPHAWVLFNESFASTNEREGSRISRQIIDGLRDSGVRVICVTHMYDLAHGLEGASDVLFLRPERLPDGRRTFRLIGGSPQPTSYGRDIYDRVFAGP